MLFTVPAVTTSATLGLGFSISRPSATTGPTVTTMTAVPTTGLTLGGFMAPTMSAPAASTGIKLGPTLTTAALTSATTSCKSSCLFAYFYNWCLSKRSVYVLKVWLCVCF